MLEGITLTLMMGPGLPSPAPQLVMDALKSVQVNSQKDRSGFQLTFTTGKQSPLLTTLLPMGYFDPMITRVIIIVTLGGMPNVLMDGLVTRQELAPSNEPGQSTLTVTGEDLSVAMDIVDMKIPYPALPDYARINVILAKYAFLGIVPAVIPPFIFDVDPPTERIPNQTGTDLTYIRGIADENGYVFYVEPGPVPGQSIAYFGPDIRIPIPQSALNVNMDAFTNVESLTFSLDGLAKQITVMTILDPAVGQFPIPVPVPNIDIFKPPLGARPTPPAKIKISCDTANLTVSKAIKKAIGIGIRSSEAITANGTLDVLRYGHVLRSRLLVGVRGAGIAYDGLYYVDSVTHNIKRGEYKQNFTLSRDGLISLTPRVLP